MAEHWNKEEHAAAVDAYLQMLSAQQRGEKFSKAEVRRGLLAGALRSRTEKSIEYRFCNISAVLAQEGKPCVDGYVPLDHLGPSGYATIVELLQDRGVIKKDDYASTADIEELEARTNRLIRRGERLFTPLGQNVVPVSESKVRVFSRDPEVRAFVLVQANGRCESCNQLAPFTTAAGVPYLEVHHVVPLANGGPDTVSNAVALCPNCHRRVHYAVDADDMVACLIAKIERLQSSS